MAKRKQPSKRQQAQHKPNSKKSQHDKRNRLLRKNPNRLKTIQPGVPLTGTMQAAVATIQAVMDRRFVF